MKDRVAVAGLLVLGVLAVLGKSAVMLVSVVGMAVAYWGTRTVGLGRQLASVAAAAVGAALLAEGVHTVYHRLAPLTSGDDTGGFFVSATLVGLINAAAFAALMLLAEWVERQRAAAPRAGGPDPRG